MKKHFILYLLLYVTISFAQQTKKIWKSDLDFGNGTVFSTFLKVEKSEKHFTITSPKNADVRMLGGFKARLARLLGKSPKKGIVVTIKGERKGDSLYGTTKIPMIGQLKFKGILTENALNGEFSQDGTAIGILKGIKSKDDRINYAYLYPKILEITNKNMYSKSALQTKDWKQFQKKLKKLLSTIHDDIELFLGFSFLSSKLPFTHYTLFVSQEIETSEKEKEKEKTVIFEEKNSNTAYLKIKNFSSSQKELTAILPKIVEKKYENLIVDLRNNGGGGIEAASELAKYIGDKDIEVGYFLTNKMQYSGFQPELLQMLPEIETKSTHEFISNLKSGKGLKLVFKKNNNPVFSGNLYILTNGKTASTCEPIVYALKKSKTATIIGEKTRGAMLAASFYQISEKYLLFLPFADFYTYDGVRLEGVGVEPNIETTSEEALQKALFLINERENK